MKYDLSHIMKEAWVIANRFRGNSETWNQRLSRALKVVWWQEKQKAQQKVVLVKTERTKEEVLHDIRAFESKDTIRGNDWKILDELRRELVYAK